MRKGIALQFKHKYGKVDQLKKQNKKIRELANLKIKRQFIIYLITKSRFYEKPKYETIFDSLNCLKYFCQNNNLKNLAMHELRVV